MRVSVQMTPPSQASIDNIYGSMLRGRFEDIPALASHVAAITSATIELWQSVKARMLPTPSKFHYIFNGQSRIFGAHANTLAADDDCWGVLRTSSMRVRLTNCFLSDALCVSTVRCSFCFAPRITA